METFAITLETIAIVFIVVGSAYAWRLHKQNHARRGQPNKAA